MCAGCPSYWIDHSTKLHVCGKCRFIDWYYIAVVERSPWKTGWDWMKACEEFEGVDVPENCVMMEEYNKGALKDERNAG